MPSSDARSAITGRHSSSSTSQARSSRFVHVALADNRTNKIAGQARSWRQVQPIHPAAELFPLMKAADLRRMSEDIKQHGLKVPVVLWAEESGKPMIQKLEAPQAHVG